MRQATVTPDDADPGGRGRRRSRWPLLVIGTSAGTATWTGWVGLGEQTGFGVVHPLPGIWDGLTVRTAITLPVGVEAYAVYALAVATDPAVLAPPARRWAWASALAALGLGMAGQVAYHLLQANGVTQAPWQIVAAVSCLPVVVLGAASLLWHLTQRPHGIPTVVAHDTAPAAQAQDLPPQQAQDDRTQRPSTDAEILADIHSDPPSIRALMRTYAIGQVRATRLHRTAQGTPAQEPDPAAEKASGREAQDLTREGLTLTVDLDDEESHPCITDRVGQSAGLPARSVAVLEGAGEG